jgi:hypothetical protein
MNSNLFYDMNDGQRKLYRLRSRNEYFVWFGATKEVRLEETVQTSDE